MTRIVTARLWLVSGFGFPVPSARYLFGVACHVNSRAKGNRNSADIVGITKNSPNLGALIARILRAVQPIGI